MGIMLRDVTHPLKHYTTSAKLVGDKWICDDGTPLDAVPPPLSALQEFMLNFVVGCIVGAIIGAIVVPVLT